MAQTTADILIEQGKVEGKVEGIVEGFRVGAGSVGMQVAFG